MRRGFDGKKATIEWSETAEGKNSARANIRSDDQLGKWGRLKQKKRMGELAK